jgi:predicted ATPase
LRAAGFRCFDEPGRKVLVSGSDEAKAQPEAFIDEMLMHSLRNYEDAHGSRLAFYDRGLPDIVAYAYRFKVSPERCELEATTNKYEATVFVAPPWQEIFVNDEVRRASFDDYLLFHRSILNIYKKLGYSIRVLPKSSVQERVEFIETTISELDA